MDYLIYFSDGGVPQAGLSPSITTYKKVGTGDDVASPPAVSEVGGGWYKFTAVPSEALAVVVDGSVTLADIDRYKFIQISPADGALAAAMSMAYLGAVQLRTYGFRSMMAGPGETITLDGAALGITPAIIAPTTGIFAGKKAQICLVTVEDAGVTVLFDGTTATATNGHKFLATDIIPGIDSYQIASKFSAIKTSGTAKLKVTPFFKV